MFMSDPAAEARRAVHGPRLSENCCLITFYAADHAGFRARRVGQTGHVNHNHNHERMTTPAASGAAMSLEALVMAGLRRVRNSGKAPWRMDCGGRDRRGAGGCVRFQFL
jgi:hypothetical protein